MTKCNNCGGTVPYKRAELGYKICVSCSNVERYGFVNIINHKTGNTVQPLPKSQADAINKIGDRKRFGTVLKGGSKSTTYNPKKVEGKVSTAVIGSEVLFDQVGREALYLLEKKSYDEAISYVEKEMKNFNISQRQGFQIRQVLDVFSSSEKQLI
jgi:hypothetical protein